MGDFVDTLRAAPTPAAQLKLLNQFRPPGDQVSEEQWDAAIYTTVDRWGGVTWKEREGGSADKKRGECREEGGAEGDVAPAATVPIWLPKPQSNPSGLPSSPPGRRSNTLKRMLRAAAAAASQADPSSGAAAAGPAAAAEVFHGPVVLLEPSDRLGKQFVEVSRQHLCGEGGPEPAHISLDARHTECVLGERARRATALQLVDALRRVLERLNA